MSWRRTLFFLFILISLAVFYYFKLYEQPKINSFSSFSTEPTQSHILETNNQEAVKRLSIQDDSKRTTISFEKDSTNQWQIISPVSFPAEPLIVDGLVTLLKLSPKSRALSLTGLDLKDFGFARPRLKICVGVTSAHKDRCLLIGSQSAIGEGAYAKWENENIYFLVEPAFLKSFDKTLYAVRKKQIFNLLNDEIKSIHFQSSKKEIEIIYQNKQWMLKKPLKAAIAPETMDPLLTELSGLYVKEFLDDQTKSDLSSKFNQAARTIQVIFQNGSEQVLIQGSEANGWDAFYARLNKPETIFLVSRGKLNKIEEIFSKLGS